MSTTVKYKGNTLATVSNNTKTLKTAGKYMEGDVVLTDVSQSAPTIQSLSVTPSETAQTFNASGVDGYKPVSVSAIPYENRIVNPTETETIVPRTEGYYLKTVTVKAISSTYVGSGITQRDSDDLTVSGATVTASAGYYSAAASKSVSSMTLPTAAASSATSGYTSKATIGRSTAAQYINIPPGYNSAGAYYVISAVANGSATAPASISGTAASVSTGNGTLTLTKTVSVTPSVTAGYVSSGTAGNSSVSLTASVTIDPTPTASGATVTIPAGYYSAQTTKSVTTMTLPTSAAASATSGYTKKATISRSTSTQYINIAPGYNSAGGYYEISAVANGSAKGPSSLSGSSATVSTGTNTLTLTKTGVTTTPTVTAGYVSSATASTATVTLTASVTTKVAATITPTTTNQTIAAGTYLTGTQTIVGDADLIASNIKKDVNIFGVTGTYDPTDFIINLTQDSSNKWIPDCTFAEAEAALNSGKALKFVAEYPAGDAYFAGYDDLGKTIAYGVIEKTSTLNGAVLIDKTFIYNAANTVTQDLTFTYYKTTQATAQASDVVSTKTFFNGSGYQTGTLDLTDIYIRSAAPTSSVGSDGDIYIQE